MKYIPKFDKDDKEMLVLDTVFDNQLEGISGKYSLMPFISGPNAE